MTGADVIVKRQRFLEPLQLPKDVGLVVQDFDGVRQALERLIERDQCLVLAAKRLQAGADIVEGIGIARGKRVRPQILGEGLRECSLTEQRPSAGR